MNGGSYMYGDRCGLLPYQQCPVPCPLDRGYPEKYVKKPNARSVGVEVLLRALHQAKVSINGFDVITFRNNLNKIGQTAFDGSSMWVIDACMITNHPKTAFLDIHDVPGDDYPGADRMCYYGYKFESLCTVSDPDAIVDATSEFGMVVERSIDDTKCAIGAEIDSYDPEKAESVTAPSLSSLVEIKTCRLPKNARQQKNAQLGKYPKWWLQSFLGGVPRIVVGRWTDEGILTSVTSMATEDLPSLALEGLAHYDQKRAWRPEQILGFLSAVIEWMHGILERNKDAQHRFVYRPTSKLIESYSCQDGDLVDRMYSSEGVHNVDYGPYFHPFPVDFEDPYADKIDNIVETYLQTRMETPLCQSSFFVDEEPSAKERMCPSLSQKLVDAGCLSFSRLQDALRPSRFKGEEKTSLDLTTWLTIRILKEIERGKYPNYEEPLVEELASIMDNMTGMLTDDADLRPLPTVNDGDRPYYLDQLAISSISLPSNFGPPLNVSQLVQNLMNHLNPRLKTSITIESDMTGTELACLSNHWNDLLHIHCEQATIREYCELDKVTAWTDFFSPEMIELEGYLHNCFGNEWMIDRLRPSMNLSYTVPLWDTPLLECKLAEKASVADEVLCELLQRDHMSVLMAPGTLAINAATASFTELLVNDLMSDTDCRSLSPVLFEGGGLLEENCLALSQRWLQSRSVTRLDIRLDWDLGESPKTPLESGTDIQMEPETEHKFSLTCNLDEATTKAVLSSASIKPKTLLGSLNPILRTTNPSVCRTQTDLAVSNTTSPEECDVNYFLRLKKKRTDKRSNIVQSFTEPLVQLDASRNAMSKTVVNHTKKIVNVELSSEIEDLLKIMHRKHKSIVNQLPMDVQKLWGQDLLDLTRLCSAKAATMDDSMKLAFVLISVLRQSSICLKELGITASCLYLKEVVKTLSVVKSIMGDLLETVQSAQDRVKRCEVVDHPKIEKVAEFIDDSVRDQQVISIQPVVIHVALQAGRVCILTDPVAVTVLSNALERRVRQDVFKDVNWSTDFCSLTDRLGIVIASHRDFLNADSCNDWKRISAFQVIIEAAPSIGGPDLDLLLQREAADGRLKCLETIIKFRTRELSFDSIEEWPRIQYPQNKKRINAAESAGVDIRDCSAKTQSSFIPGPHQSHLSAYECIEDESQECRWKPESMVKCRKLHKIADNVLDSGGWNNFRFRKRERMQQGSLWAVKPSSITKKADQCQQMLSTPSGLRISTKREAQYSKIEDPQMESEPLFSCFEWELDSGSSDDLQTFDASFSTDLASMTSISGLEVTSSRTTHETAEFKGLTEKPRHWPQESDDLLLFDNQLNGHPDSQSKRGLGLSTQRKTPRAKETSLIQKMRFSPDYSRIKRTSERPVDSCNA